MNLDLLQAALLQGLPTAADVAAGRHVVTTSEVAIIIRRDGENVACGPYSTKDVEWHRLPPDARIFEPTP